MANLPELIADLQTNIEPERRLALMRAQQQGLLGGGADTLPGPPGRDVRGGNIEDPMARALSADLLLGMNPVTGPPLAAHDAVFFGREAVADLAAGDLLPAAGNAGLAGLSALGVLPGVPPLGKLLAAVKVGDEVFTGNTHGQALAKAMDEGKLTKGEEGLLVDEFGERPNADLFMQSDGSLIDRFEASSKFDVASAERADDLGLIQERIGPARISTRFPTGKTAVENPLTDDLRVGLESMLDEPDKFAKNIDLISQYDGFRPGPTEPVQQAEQFIEQVKSNLLAVHDAIPAEIRERSKQWYVGANRTAKELAEEYELSHEATSGIIAALSPQKDWFENREMAKRVLEVSRAKPAWSKEMDAAAREVISTTKMLKAVRGKTFDELTDPVQRAWWIRAYDKAHNDPRVQIVTPEGDDAGKFADSPIRWGSAASIAKALRIIDNPTIDNISTQMGEAHKVRNFYNNIADPFSDAGDVTIDTHAVAIGTLLPLGGEALEVSHNLGSGLKLAEIEKSIRLGQAHIGATGRGPANSRITGSRGTYGLYAEAYRRAAAERGLLPREMQSITWEGAQGLFPRNFKTAPNRREARRIWREYRDGILTLEQAQQNIFEMAGGIDAPIWARPSQ